MRITDSIHINLLHYVILLCLIAFPMAGLAEASPPPIANSSLDIVSITTDPDGLWNPDTGIWAEGDAIDKSQGLPFVNAVYRLQLGATIEGVVEYYSSETDALAFSHAVTLSLEGDAFSLDMPQKGLRISTLGDPIDYPLFDGGRTRYGSFVLSNAESDGAYTRIAEGVQRQLIDKYIDTALLFPAWKPVIVYLNGAYWGHYNMRETIDSETVRQYEHTHEADAVSIINASGKALQGDASEYAKMIPALKTSSPQTSAEDRTFLDEQIDVDSFLDWLAVKIFFGDPDPSTAVYYQTTGGKWKCIASGFDLGLFSSTYNSPSAYTKETGMGVQNIENAVFLKILEVDEYRTLFLSKLGNIYQTLTTEVMQNELDVCVSLIEAEMPAHFTRWAPLHDAAFSLDWPTEPDEALAFWYARIDRMREKTMVNRPFFLYHYVQDTFELTKDEMMQFFGELDESNPLYTDLLPLVNKD